MWQASGAEVTPTSSTSTVTTSATVTDDGKLELADGQSLQAIQFADGSTAIINQKGKNSCRTKTTGDSCNHSVENRDTRNNYVIESYMHMQTMSK